jgi:hypothetical protein
MATVTTAMEAAQSIAIVICASDAPRDRAFVRRLARDLRRVGLTPLFHHRRKETARPADEIERAHATLVVVSPQLAESPKAREEYLRAVQGRKLIIPMQTGADIPLPVELAGFQYVDFYALYESGLLNLCQSLGRPRRDGMRRVRIAAIAGAVIPFARTALATVLLASWLILTYEVFRPYGPLVAAIPALFIAVGAEDYRRGDPVRFRVMLAQILAGAGIGALPGYAIGAIVDSGQTRLLIVAIPTVAGGFLGWLLTWVEQRSVRRGRLGLSRTLSVLRFLLNAALIAGAFIALSFQLFPLASPGPAQTLDVVGLVVVGLAVAAAIEWLRSPVHRVKGERRQLAEARPGVSQVRATPAVFISHASADNAFTIKLAGDLQQRGIATWMDRRALRPGMVWSDEIGRALESAGVVLLALSPFALASDWVRREYQAALAHGKNIFILRLDDACVVPPELAQARVIDFATLYVSGLTDVLVALHSDQATVAVARKSLMRRLTYAWLINTVRLVVSSYLILARIVVFGVASFALLGGFDTIAGIHNLGSYSIIWLLRAAPGAALGLLVGLAERARIEGAKPAWWISVARVVNGALLGEGLLGAWSLGFAGVLLAPLTWLAISFLDNQSPFDGSLDSSSLIFVGVVVGVGAVNAALAIPLARSERFNREAGKFLLINLSRIAQFSSRLGIGMIGFVAPIYLFFASPVAPLGPPPEISTFLGFWTLIGLEIGAAVAAVELFFFPAGPSRQSLRKLRQIVLSKGA